MPGQFSPATFTPGGLTSSSFHPKLGPEHGANSGGAFASGHQGGLDVLLQYTFTPAAAVVEPGRRARPPCGPPTSRRSAGSILRPIGGGLDVVLNCLQTTCRGTLNVLSRSPVTAAAKAKRIRSLGKATFVLQQGPGRKVKVRLNALGRKLARRASTKVQVVVDLGAAGTTTRNLTLKPAKKR